MSLDTGKNFKDCLNEINYCSKLWFEASRVNNTFFDSKITINKTTEVFKKKQPIGIVGIFLPFNNYMVVLSERLPFALVSGCTAIVKPNPMGILCIIKLIKFIKKYLNKNLSIINLIVGDIRLSKQIIKSKEIKMIDFTGSKKVGDQVMFQGLKSSKKVSLELGGKNPSIICKDIDINKVIKIIIRDFTGNAGQNCVAISRVYINKDIYENFKKILLDKIKKIKIYQPLRNNNNFLSIKKYLKINKKKLEKKIIYGNLNITNPIVKPLIFEKLDRKNYLYKEELFAPILVIDSFENIQEAISKANDSEYGLSGSLWTKNHKLGQNIIDNIESGRLWLNGSIYQNYPFLRVGGLKKSGNGRVAGIESIENYTVFKTIIVNK